MQLDINQGWELSLAMNAEFADGHSVLKQPSIVSCLMGIIEKIKDIEAELARTQKNKATEFHVGILKARLAKYRTQLLEGGQKSSGPGEGFDVKKVGDARVALIGFPRSSPPFFPHLLVWVSQHC